MHFLTNFPLLLVVVSCAANAEFVPDLHHVPDLVQHLTGSAAELPVLQQVTGSPDDLARHEEDIDALTSFPRLVIYPLLQKYHFFVAWKHNNSYFWQLRNEDPNTPITFAELSDLLTYPSLGHINNQLHFLKHNRSLVPSYAPTSLCFKYEQCILYSNFPLTGSHSLEISLFDPPLYTQNQNISIAVQPIPTLLSAADFEYLQKENHIKELRTFVRRMEKEACTEYGDVHFCQTP